MTKFINREQEWAFLNRKWREKVAQMVVVYGKRRVGKTELIRRFIADKPAVYLLADRRAMSEQLKELGRLIGQYFADATLEKNGFGDWLETFAYLSKIKKPFILAIDEYPYLVDLESSTSSVFQKGWDQYLKNSKVFLILSGSSVGMMERETLLYRAPLFGRRTGQMCLKPMAFAAGWQFHPGLTFGEFLAFFAVVGGMPAYLLQFEAKKSLLDNLRQKVFVPNEFLFNEVEFLLKEELREPKNYLALLRSIAWGRNKFSEMVSESGLQRNIVHRYLQTLENLQLVEREVPVTEKQGQKSRLGVYRIADNFVRFWFQLVFPYKSDLEIGRLETVLAQLKIKLPILEAATYERLAQNIFWELQDKMVRVDRIGRWWSKGEEIDLVGLNEEKRQIVLGEVKWSNRLVGLKVYEELKRKATLVEWNKGEREEYFVLFSKNGFTSALKKLAKKERIFLVRKNKLVVR